MEFECIESFFEFKDCEDPYTLVYVANDSRYWYAKVAELFTHSRYSPPEPQAILADLGNRYILVLGSREREPDADLVKRLVEEARKRFRISDKIVVEEVIGKYIIDDPVVILRVKDEEYAFRITDIPLPIYFGKDLIIMAYAVRASVLNDEEEILVATYKDIIKEANELINNVYKYAVGRVKIPEEVYKHREIVFKPGMNYYFKSKVLIIEGNQTKEQALREIRNAIEVAKAYLIPELKKILVEAMILMRRHG